MKAFLISTFAIIALCGSAAASQDSDELGNNMQAIGNDMMEIVRNACRGPQVEDKLLSGLYRLSGIPGNQKDEIKCESVSVLVPSCMELADKAGSYLSQVDDGETTFDDIEKSRNNSTGNDATTSAALVLAEQAPSGTNPSKLLNEIFKECKGIIDHK
jgi:hypothetical protein